MTSLSLYHIALFSIAVPAISGAFGKKQNRIALFVACAIMVFVSGLRHGYIDTRAYRNGFEAMDAMSVFDWQVLSQSRSPGFSIIEGVIRLFSENGQTFLFIMALITVVCLFYGIVKNAPAPALGVFLLIATGCYMDTMNGLRQALAAAILFYFAPKLIQKRKLVPFLLLVAVAWSIHLSALIYLPMYWVCNAKAWSKKTWGLVVCGLLIYIFFNFGVGNLAANILESASGDSSYYSGYSEMLLSANTSVNGVRLIIAAAPVLLSFFAKRDGHGEVTQYDIYVHMSILNMIIWLLATKVLYFYRLNMFFTPYMILQLCWSIEYLPVNSKTRSQIKAVTIVLYFIFHLYSVYTMGGAFLVGYLKY